LSTEPAGEAFEREGLSYHYTDVGSGPPLIFLHGGGPGVTAWNTYAQNVDALASSFRLILVDQPGYGKSAQDPGFRGSYWDYAAAVVAALIGHLELDKVGVVAHSMGGGTAIRLCLDHPEKVDRLTLIGSAGLGAPSVAPMPTEGQSLLRRVRVAMEAGDQEEVRRLLREFMQAQLFDQDYLREESFEERYASATSELSGSNMQRALSRLDPTLPSQLGKVTRPSLLIWGKDDRVAPLETAIAALARIPESRLVVFSRCGHLPQTEHARDFETAVSTFNSGK
jgi:4,5:9,10-diseco-3-hydroxy-5,9,17-trioxoandrosta-1(10),2-diene-4-oate hydrolase